MTQTIEFSKLLNEEKYQNGEYGKAFYLLISIYLEYGINYENLCTNQVLISNLDEFCEKYSIEPDKELGVKGLKITRKDVLGIIGKLIDVDHTKDSDLSILDRTTGVINKSIQLNLFD